jgi:hypothetical protein
MQLKNPSLLTAFLSRVPFPSRNCKGAVRSLSDRTMLAPRGIAAYLLFPGGASNPARGLAFQPVQPLKGGVHGVAPQKSSMKNLCGRKRNEAGASPPSRDRKGAGYR